MSLTPRYLSAGANRHSSAADWSDSGLLAFGSDSNVALWKPAARGGIVALLRGHRDAVQAVRFVPRLAAGEPEYLVSGAARQDPSLKLWAGAAGEEDGAGSGFRCVQTVESAHLGAVNCIAACRASGLLPSRAGGKGSSRGSRRLVATGSADATIKIWSLDDGATAGAGALTLVQTIDTENPRFIPLSLAISPLDDSGDSFILVAAGTRNSVQVYTSSTSSSTSSSTPPSTQEERQQQLQFSLQATLPGHEDWIRSLDIVAASGDDDDATGDLLIASGSGDKYVRLWRVHAGADDSPAERTVAVVDSADVFLPGRKPTNKAHRIRCGGETTKSFSVTFEALLLGHEDWVYGVRWRRSPVAAASQNGSGHGHGRYKLRLLSASADNSLAVWEADAASGIWVTVARLGEVSREKGATTATGSTGGFWAGLWGPDGKEVVCLTRTGSWRRWVAECGGGGDGDEETWRQDVAVTGHTRAVTGIAWSRSGDYLLSTGLDQTTRLHAPWSVHDAGQKSAGSSPVSWHEMSRPQIHGYDLNCVDSLGDSQFVSGADEKLMRVFHEPRAVANLLRRVSAISAPKSGPGAQALPDAADMPVLGLSNKSVDTPGAQDSGREAKQTTREREEAGEDRPAMHATMLDTPRPPTEDVVSRYTLWPETEKLYGHGYEISCLACSHDGSLIASACRASSTNHAVIRLFETARWTEVRPPLAAHSLTATRLRFSPRDRFLLSVGRDRAWAVFERTEEQEGRASGPFRLRQSVAKAHSRMILDGAWGPPSSGKQQQQQQQQAVFATAGRDKQVRIWALASTVQEGKAEKDAEFTCVRTIAADEPVTAVDFLPWAIDDDTLMVLAVGTEAGKLVVYSISTETLAVVSSLALDESLSPARPIIQLAWRPRRDGEQQGGQDEFELAVASEDGSLRLLSCQLG